MIAGMVHPLTAWREAHGVTKGALARALRVSWRTLHRIEQGKATPSLDVTLGVERETKSEVTAEMLAAARLPAVELAAE